VSFLHFDSESNLRILWLDISNVFVQKLQSQRLNIKKAINLLEEICTVPPPCVAAFAADVLSSNDFFVKWPHGGGVILYI